MGAVLSCLGVDSRSRRHVGQHVGIVIATGGGNVAAIIWANLGREWPVTLGLSTRVVGDISIGFRLPGRALSLHL